MQNGKKASRVNLLGTVVSVPAVEMSYRSITLDDGSGTIPIRSFDETDLFKSVGLGDVVFVIGRPREYGSEIYVMPEIVKKVQNKLWIDVRKLEIGCEVRAVEKKEPEALPKVEDLKAEEETPAEDKAEPAVEKEDEPNTQQKVYSLIKALDKGEGADFEEVIEKANSPEAEKIISQLLMEGEIFELSKGKLKVLE
jgi:RPA family protein